MKRGLGPIALVIVIAPMLLAPRAEAQCSYDWRPGNGAPGVRHHVAAVTSWDPDGLGPQPQLLIAGGTFDHNGTDHHVQMWDGANWIVLPGLISDGATSVNALIVYGGELIAGGWFYLEDGSLNGIARWNGTTWERLGGGTAGIVKVLQLFEGDLVAGGDFSTMGGVPANGIARWDGVSWSGFGSGLIDVTALGTYNGALIAAAGHVKRWNGTSWDTISSGLSITGDLYALEEYGDELFVAGGFISIDGGDNDGLVRWDGTTWRSADSPGGANALIVHNGELVAGGGFSPNCEQQEFTNIARWDGTAWRVLGSGTTSTVHALGIHDGHLFAVILSSPNLLRWDGASWRPVGSGFDGVVRSTTVYNGDLVVGGDFATAGDGVHRNIARWDGMTWHPLGNVFKNRVNALRVFNGMLIAGGAFSVGDGCHAPLFSGIAQWDGTIWQRPLGAGDLRDVFALSEYNGELIVGGSFSSRMRRWNGTTWQTLGGMNSSVLALAVYNNELIAGGTFTQVGLLNINRIARWNGTFWQALGTGMNGAVNALTVYNGELIAAGDFTTAWGVPVNRVARWNGAGWNSLGAGLNGTVHTLNVYDGELDAGGAFDLADGLPANKIARWNGAVWQPLDAGMDGTVITLGTYNADLVAGGSFTRAGVKTSAYLARWAEICDCNENGIADDQELAGNDCDANGIPDECEACGDLDDDQDVDGDDFSAFLLAFGSASEAASFQACADLDSDGQITLVDYQNWLACYRDFVANPSAAAPMPGDIGDLNADGLLNGWDIQPFVDVILQPGQADFRSRIIADLDGDGSASQADILPFAAHLEHFTLERSLVGSR